MCGSFHLAKRPAWRSTLSAWPRLQTPATLVLAGNSAADDPEGPAMYESICARSGERIIVTLPMIHCSRPSRVPPWSCRSRCGKVSGSRSRRRCGRGGRSSVATSKASATRPSTDAQASWSPARAQAFPDDAAARGLARLDHLACAAKVRTNFHTGTGGRRLAFGRQGKMSVRLFSGASLKSHRSPKACLPSSKVAPSALSPG
jgi:hypothetical protein